MDGEGGDRAVGGVGECCRRCCCCTITKRIRTAPNPSPIAQACTPTPKPKHDGFLEQHVLPPPPTIPLDCSYHRTRLHLTSRDSFVDCSPSAQRAHKAPGASSALALINISEQSFPTGDPQQTMTHPSGFHLSSPY